MPINSSSECRQDCEILCGTLAEIVSPEMTRSGEETGWVRLSDSAGRSSQRLIGLEATGVDSDEYLVAVRRCTGADTPCPLGDYTEKSYAKRGEVNSPATRGLANVLRKLRK